MQVDFRGMKGGRRWKVSPIKSGIEVNSLKERSRVSRWANVPTKSGRVLIVLSFKLRKVRLTILATSK